MHMNYLKCLTGNWLRDLITGLWNYTGWILGGGSAAGQGSTSLGLFEKMLSQLWWQIVVVIVVVLVADTVAVTRVWGGN